LTVSTSSKGKYSLDIFPHNFPTIRINRLDGINGNILLNGVNVEKAGMADAQNDDEPFDIDEHDEVGYILTLRLSSYQLLFRVEIQFV
jgi:hypothetical protein